MKVLVADKFEKSGLDGLAKLGAEVSYQPDLKDDSLAEALNSSGAEALVVRSTKVTAPMMQCENLALIVRAGAGYNTIDVAAASERGIFVTNCPGKNSIAVAELAFGLLIACDRHIPDNVASLREGKWNKKAYSKARGLYGRTLGLIGLGNIGQEMVKRGKAFGMNVAVCSRWMTKEVAAALGITPAANIEELAKLSDFVSVHVALTSETKGMLGKKFFDCLQPGSVFVNTSRAEVVDQAVLETALEERDLVAGLDVFNEEPAGAEGEYSGSLKSNCRVYGTHHIGASTDQAQEAVAEEVVRIVSEYMSKGTPPNLVNVSKGEPVQHLLQVRYADKLGVLPFVLDTLRNEGVNVQEMENVVLDGSKAAIAQIATDKQPTDALLAAIRQNASIFDAHVMPIPK